MVTLHVTIAVLASLSSLALAITGFALGRPGWIRRGFVTGMLLLGVEALSTTMLLGDALVFGDHRFWLSVREAARLLVPLAWLVFVAALTRRHDAPLPSAWRSAVAAGGAAAGLLFGVEAIFGGVSISHRSGPFAGGVLSVFGVVSVAFQLLLVVGVLAGLEACLRTSHGPVRRRTKFLVLGLGGIFLVKFYLLSQAALFRSLTATDLRIDTSTLLIGNLVLGVGLVRARSSQLQLTVSRALVYRSVIVGILGAYLLAVGGLGWALRYFDIPEQTLWVTVGAFVSALLLAVVLLSEEARWRVKRFVAVHVYRSKYDYRQQWITFTRRLSTLLTLGELGPQLLETLTQAVDSNAAVLYVIDDSDRTYHVAGTLDAPDVPSMVPRDLPPLTALAARQEPLMLDMPLDWAGGAVAHIFPEGSVAVPLGWRGRLIGFVLVGPERTGLPYSLEDLEFMSTIGQQATGSIVTARLSENLARSREFDAFARLASFVVHDLKNMISSLSLLAQNAVKYFDDPEFQKDTAVTVSKTVERMQRLLTRLSSRAESVALRGETVELLKVVRDSLETIAVPDGLKVMRELQPVAPVAGDAEALVRVVQNLVSNAIQATEREGTVTVTLRQDAGQAVLIVADTGCGMSEQFVRESLFVPFRTTKPGGWGVGLYQVKEIVERHQGTLSVTTKEGGGTTFQVAFPIRLP